MALPVPAPANVYTPPEDPIVVIGEQFVASYPVDLTLQEKSFTLGENDFTIKDANGTPIFKVKGKLFSIRDQRTLLDAAGNPVVCFRQKIFTMHRRWQVFRGDSTTDLLFSVRKSSLLQFRTTLDVFLAANTSESKPDFTVKGGFREHGCTICSGSGENNVVGQMHRKHSLKNMIMDKDCFQLTALPNVDYAFIVTLVVILDEINADRSGED
ncbi:hypothetical protein COLO4_03319 [Corchorus olitorius]|uniref:LURP1-like domain-containing protein n=1 Tax=Corchorus olitorius TaxID=93759 RepID=A0A1R3KYY4_9ROSI|nr:hypothetical protein COLO4_03319 [Corchorus olitorius]